MYFSYRIMGENFRKSFTDLIMNIIVKFDYERLALLKSCTE